MTDSATLPAEMPEILIAEDSPAQARLLAFILEQLGYRVVHAVNGRLALEAARRRKPALIISDILMPEMDGYQLSAAVKADPGLKDVPLILLTTLTDPNDVIRGLECGAENFILKPYDEDYLVGRVRASLIKRSAPVAEEPSGPIEIVYGGEKWLITASRRQILNLMLSIYDAGMQRNKQLSEAELSLRAQNKLAEEANRRLQLEIVERDKVEQALRFSQTQLNNLNNNLDGLVNERTVELREATRRHFTLLGNLPGVAYRSGIDRARTMEFVSEGSQELLGIPPRDFTKGKAVYGSLIHVDDRDRVWRSTQASLQARTRSECEYRIHHADGTWRRVWERSQGIYDEGGQLLAIEGFIADVTARDKIERQLREVQRMDAIGRLTGGLAHDLNNYLVVILGNLDMLAECRHVDPQAAKLIEGAIGGAERSAELASSLLSFSRRQLLDPRLTDVGLRVAAVAKLLERAIPEDIVVGFGASADLWRVDIDETQLDICIVNLANNARDAMPKGGTLTIAVRNVAAGGPDALSTDHVLIELTDTGSGMSPEEVALAFEPFFSTKGPGHGSGLGLSMVHGFVHQSGGVIRLTSTLGVGTTVRIFIPRASDGETGASVEPRPGSAPKAAGETVLVVEDNESVRATTVGQLTSLGYRVIEAESGEGALRVLERGETVIDLVFTDVVMPGELDGYALARLVLDRWPTKKVLLTSGYSAGVDDVDDLDEQAMGLRTLGKPYRKAQLAQAMRVALNG
jgi:PAS domain S-box-containing protein